MQRVLHDRLSQVGTVDTKGPAQAPISEAARHRVLNAYGKLPLYFIENRGQIDGAVAYYIQGRDTTVYFTPQGLTFVLTSPVNRQPTLSERLRRAVSPSAVLAAEPTGAPRTS